MHIAVDLDDVTVDFWRGVLNALKKEYDLDIDYDATTDWARNTVKELDIFGEGRTWWDWLKDRDWLWATFQPVPGAIGGIQQLRQRGHYVEAVTKKPDWAEWTVWRWLGRWRPPFNQVTIVPSGQKKCEATSADLLIDDSPDNIKCWLDESGGRQLIVFERPWNKGAYPHLTCKTWADILKVVGREVR